MLSPGRSSLTATVGGRLRHVQVIFTGLAQIGRHGPVFRLRIPIGGPHLAHDLGQPCAMCVVQKSAWARSATDRPELIDSSRSRGTVDRYG